MEAVRCAPYSLNWRTAFRFGVSPSMANAETCSGCMVMRTTLSQFPYLMDLPRSRSFEIQSSGSSPAINLLFWRTNCLRFTTLQTLTISYGIWKLLINPALRFHLSPQYKFLGRELGYYDKVFRLEELDELATYLSRRSGSQIDIPMTNTSGAHNICISTLSLDKLRKIYEVDFELLKAFYEKTG